MLGKKLPFTSSSIEQGPLHRVRSLVGQDNEERRKGGEMKMSGRTDGRATRTTHGAAPRTAAVPSPPRCWPSNRWPPPATSAAAVESSKTAPLRSPRSLGMNMTIQRREGERGTGPGPPLPPPSRRGALVLYGSWFGDSVLDATRPLGLKVLAAEDVQLW